MEAVAKIISLVTGKISTKTMIMGLIVLSLFAFQYCNNRNKINALEKQIAAQKKTTEIINRLQSEEREKTEQLIEKYNNQFSTLQNNYAQELEKLEKEKTETKKNYENNNENIDKALIEKWGIEVEK